MTGVIAAAGCMCACGRTDNGVSALGQVRYVCWSCAMYLCMSIKQLELMVEGEMWRLMALMAAHTADDPTIHTATGGGLDGTDSCTPLMTPPCTLP